MVHTDGVLGSPESVEQTEKSDQIQQIISTQPSGSHGSVSIALTGSGGSGVMTAGQMALDAAAGAGYQGMMTRSMGPQIRGGEAAAFLRLSAHEVSCPGDGVDVLISFDWASTERFSAEIELGPDSLVLFDPAAGDAPEMILNTGARLIELPFKEMISEIEGGRPNMLALGVLAGLIGLPEDAVLAIVEKALKRKGPKALEASSAGIRAGYGASAAMPATFRLGAGEKAGKRWNISGNEAVGLGALRGGIRFVAAYPITPATEILEWLAPNLEHLGGELVQAEDELASINMAIGGSFGGIPTLTATSGPGLALMLESIGLSVASETPVVIVNVQRGGPSTGIPTKSEQSDLNIALFGLHGDAPHIVTAANSVSDCAFTAQWSVYLAEALQSPAIVLTDQLLGQTRSVIDEPVDSGHVAAREIAPAGLTDYRRYAVTESGVSPMAIPGTPGGEYVADGLEHSPIGRPSSQAEDHLAQLEKRQRKLDRFDYADHWADIEGDGDTAVITWGSCTGPVREACARAREAGISVRMISLRLLAPMQTVNFARAMKGVKRALVVEQSHSQQFYRYLRAYYDLPSKVKVWAKPGPLPVRPADIYDKIVNWS
ncbi:MAG: 2-oxoacid:acceptor oxidoreductase subunit alpha [Alphaproteobacteria bacterium]|nr:2-oxoacid:acceptor oxidoreductase subunit alpha [Alphaproteobacteria bacterium]